MWYLLSNNYQLINHFRVNKTEVDSISESSSNKFITMNILCLASFPFSWYVKYDSCSSGWNIDLGFLQITPHEAYPCL